MRLNELRQLSPTQWEAICQRCGRCCYEKLDDGGTIYYTSAPCDRLDLQSCLCTVYEQRNTVRPDCMPLTVEVLQAGYLPADCPYVAGLEDYPAPQMDGGDEL